MTRPNYPRPLSEHADGKWPAVQHLLPLDPEQLHHPFERGE